VRLIDYHLMFNHVTLFFDCSRYTYPTDHVTVEAVPDLPVSFEVDSGRVVSIEMVDTDEYLPFYDDASDGRKDRLPFSFEQEYRESKDVLLVRFSQGMYKNLVCKPTRNINISLWMDEKDLLQIILIKNASKTIVMPSV
jgi:hypothetical protein